MQGMRPAAFCVMNLLVLAAAIAAAAPAAAPATAVDSPRHTVEALLDDAHQGHLDAAAGYLELSAVDRFRGAELARELADVIDTQTRVDPAALSTSPDGDASAALPAGHDVIARVGDPVTGEPIELVRSTRGTGARWLFSAATVAKIDAWHARIERPWLDRWLPSWLRAVGPGGVLRWQWIAAVLAFAIALVLGSLIGGATRRGLARIARRTRTTVDDHLVAHMRGPIVWAWTVLLWWLAMGQLQLTPAGAVTIHSLARLLVFYGFFWVLLRGVDLAIALVRGTAWAGHHMFSRSLLPLSARVAKAIVIAIAIVSILSELGYPVASIIAGLGVGGIAVALAAQKTVENLFGAFALGVDQPFREGDTIRIEGGATGTVERIGLRSTRLRTPDRLAMSVPNAKLADARIESFASVDRVRLETTLHLSVATTPEAMRRVLDGLAGLLAHGAHAPSSPPEVHFAAIGDHSLDVSVVAWFDSGVGDDLGAIRDDFLLGCLDTVARAGTSLVGAPVPAAPPAPAPDRARARS
jgi:MscS family membrane protein